MHLGRTKSPENVSIDCKCRLVPISRFDSAEPLDAIRGTPRFHETLVQKYWVGMQVLTRFLENKARTQ